MWGSCGLEILVSPFLNPHSPFSAHFRDDSASLTRDGLADSLLQSRLVAFGGLLECRIRLSTFEAQPAVCKLSEHIHLWWSCSVHSKTFTASQKCEKLNNIVNMKCLEPQIWHINKGLPAWGAALPFPGGPVAETALPRRGSGFGPRSGDEVPHAPAKDPVQPKKWILFLFTELCVTATPWTPGSSVRCRLEFAQIHVRWVGDAILLSHPLLLRSPLFIFYKQK